MTPPATPKRKKRRRSSRDEERTYQRNFYEHDPNRPERSTPINYDDPNDHRNYNNGMDLGLPPIGNMGNGLTYNDFDYIGYNTRDTKMFQSHRSNQYNQL